MVNSAFHQHSIKRHAAWLALFAMLLILVAPLISVSLQKDPMSTMPGMHHDMMSMPAHHEGAPVMMPVDHAEACGYCVLLAHVPGVMLLVTLLLCGLLRHAGLKTPPPVVGGWHFFPWLCPDTRAPPRRSAFSTL
nr:DUF2946 domain-containing protein [uncultured Enterobacter sp.]